ncbi:hypothetical protein R3W88_014738 [Solanum pinnatisectum]|uniref:Late blight resistance protein n=1 Tax=Solanum pinnatisectum TaxID=50273 RepID=A0AAV9KUV2_9SOLN|nr:hypothetical protein R3W88_014738 [Solanum pinnatisectum]
MDLIEMLKYGLAFICTYVQFSYFGLEEFKDKMARKRQEVENLLRPILYMTSMWMLNVDFDVEEDKYDMHHVLSSLMDNIDNCISSCHHSSSSTTIIEEQLDLLLLNIHHLSKYCKVCGNIRDFHGLIVNGYIEHESVEYVLPQLQPMAEKVGLFLSNDQTDEDSRLFKLSHLLMKITPIEVEVMHIFYINLKASTSTEVECFIKQLQQTFTDVLREYLIHLQEHMVTVVAPTTSGARNIHVMIEFLLIILFDVPKDFIHHDKLFDLLEHVGALSREVCSLYSNAYSIALIKEEIEQLKEDLEFIRSFFLNIEQELYKDLWEHVLDVACLRKGYLETRVARMNYWVLEKK